jgi:hypothetical protein
MVTLYCGINETKWNHHPVAPGPYACIAPVYGATERTHKENCVRVPPDTQVIQDSGAFSDGPTLRLSLSKALDRQREHSDKYAYTDLLTHRASYDLLIDEKWVDGARRKDRWGESAAREAVEVTISAAKYMDRYGRESGISLIQSAQGVSVQQYLECVRQVLPYTHDGDWLGLGGWCIIGRRRKLMSVFSPMLRLVVPLVAREGVQHIHIWGVVYAPALGQLLYMTDQYGLTMSTDSAGPSMRPAFGHWGYMGWREKDYKRPPVETRGLERARHVRATRDWLSKLRDTEHYRLPA